MDGLGGGNNNASNNQLNLRDFGPGRTLVLVNGKRRANYPYPQGDGDASFNWNRIPIGIVERIEILTSGASAVYGSDAVAGVVNVILVDGMEEFAVQARVGAHQPFTNRSAGESVNIEISGGKYFDNGSMVYGIDLSTVNPLRGTDREQLDDIYDEPVGYYHYGDTILIPQGTKHRVENTEQDDLVFIEVQHGSYFGEDDIVRIEDDYNRK